MCCLAVRAAVGVAVGESGGPDGEGDRNRTKPSVPSSQPSPPRATRPGTHISVGAKKRNQQANRHSPTRTNQPLNNGAHQSRRCLATGWAAADFRFGAAVSSLETCPRQGLDRDLVALFGLVISTATVPLFLGQNDGKVAVLMLFGLDVTLVRFMCVVG